MAFAYVYADHDRREHVREWVFELFSHSQKLPRYPLMRTYTLMYIAVVFVTHASLASLARPGCRHHLEDGPVYPTTKSALDLPRFFSCHSYPGLLFPDCPSAAAVTAACRLPKS